MHNQLCKLHLNLVDNKGIFDVSGKFNLNFEAGSTKLGPYIAFCVHHPQKTYTKRTLSKSETKKNARFLFPWMDLIKKII
jgi:hypothetical protein